MSLMPAITPLGQTGISAVQANIAAAVRDAFMDFFAALPELGAEADESEESDWDNDDDDVQEPLPPAHLEAQPGPQEPDGPLLDGVPPLIDLTDGDEQEQQYDLTHDDIVELPNSMLRRSCCVVSPFPGT